MLDDSGLCQLIENVPVEFGTGLEEKRSGVVVRRVSVGQIKESVSFGQNHGLEEWQLDFDTFKICCSCEW